MIRNFLELRRSLQKLGIDPDTVEISFKDEHDLTRFKLEVIDEVGLASIMFPQTETTYLLGLPLTSRDYLDLKA